MSDKTGNHDWDDFKEESEALEREMNELDEKIDDVLNEYEKGDES